MSKIIEDVIKIIVKFIFDIFLTFTGEIVLFVLTFGKHKPRWHLYIEESASGYAIIISIWIGIAFWLIAIMIVYWFFVRG